MCYPVTCPVCGKTTWEGCGEHVEEALAGVPEGDRCQGHPDQAPRQSGFFARLTGR